MTLRFESTEISASTRVQTSGGDTEKLLASMFVDAKFVRTCRFFHLQTQLFCLCLVCVFVCMTRNMHVSTKHPYNHYLFYVGLHSFQLAWGIKWQLVWVSLLSLCVCLWHTFLVVSLLKNARFACMYATKSSCTWFMCRLHKYSYRNQACII